MLTMDETWLTHAARIRSQTSVTPSDVQLEDSLFRFEAILKKAERQFPTNTRRAKTPPQDR
jgi:hypothetical protein